MATEAAHDPIAIAALIAELPELEAKYAEAKEAAEIANKALDVIQDRIDQAIAVLKKKAPKGSKWGNHVNKVTREIGAQDLQQLAQNYKAQRVEAPPPIKRGVPWV